MAIQRNFDCPETEAPCEDARCLRRSCARQVADKRLQGPAADKVVWEATVEQWRKDIEEALAPDQIADKTVPN